MTDPESGDDLPIVDVRSPAERWADSGRTGFDRLQARLSESPFDVAAVAWMIFLLGLIGLQVYTAFRGTGFGEGPTTGWEKATLIASTGNIVISFGAAIGIALAIAYATTAARTALWMAVVAGVWVVIANVVGIAVAFHDESGGSGFVTFTRGTENKVVQALGSVMEAGFGLVILVIAYSLLMAGRRGRHAEPEIAELG
jgi:hypothetical protein